MTMQTEMYKKRFNSITTANTERINEGGDTMYWAEQSVSLTLRENLKRKGTDWIN